MQFSNIWNLLREIKMSLTLAISRPRYNFVKFFLHIPPSYLENRLIEGFYLTVSMYKLWAQKASELALKSRHGGSWPFISLALSDKRSEQIIFWRKSQFQKMRRWSHQPPNFSLTTKFDLKDTWKGIKLNFEMKVSLAQLLDLGTLCLIGLVVMLY